MTDLAPGCRAMLPVLSQEEPEVLHHCLDETISPLGLLFYFVYTKPKRILNNIVFIIKALRGV